MLSLSQVVLSPVRERTARDGLPDASVEKDQMEFLVYSLGSLVLNVRILLSFYFFTGFSMLLVPPHFVINAASQGQTRDQN
jgi:hypothetical protein